MTRVAGSSGVYETQVPAHQTKGVVGWVPKNVVPQHVLLCADRTTEQSRRGRDGRPDTIAHPKGTEPGTNRGPWQEDLNQPRRLSGLVRRCWVATEASRDSNNCRISTLTAPPSPRDLEVRLSRDNVRPTALRNVARQNDLERQHT